MSGKDLSKLTRRELRDLAHSLSRRVQDLEFVVLQARALAQSIRRNRQQCDVDCAGFGSPLLNMAQDELDSLRCFDIFYEKYINPMVFKERP